MSISGTGDVVVMNLGGAEASRFIRPADKWQFFAIDDAD
jgi:hypothetical protein